MGYWELFEALPASEVAEENFVLEEFADCTLLKNDFSSPIVSVGSQFGVQAYVKRSLPL